MKKAFLLSLAVMACLLGGCVTEATNSWQLRGKAITGAGAVPGKDYVTGLKPSEGARRYFAKLDKAKPPTERVRRGMGASRSGVKFYKNGGILIPPGVTITFTNRGYCMDPRLPAPRKGDEFQLIPMTQLIPADLQSTYLKLAAKSGSATPRTKANSQHLFWALRTAGTEAAYANNLTAEQKGILDSCSGQPGLFSAFHAREKAKAKMMKDLLGMADSMLTVKVGGVAYKASDLLEPEVGLQKINSHLNQLIAIGQSLPVERTGLNYGEIYPGIYTDVRGTGPLEYRARIANSTSKPFVFYPTYYVAQAGSPVKHGALFAAPDATRKQRVTGQAQVVVDTMCITPDGKPETIVLDYRDRSISCKSVDEAKKKFEKYAEKLGADSNCIEVHSAIITTKDGKVYLLPPKKTNQNTKLVGGHYEATNKVVNEHVAYGDGFKRIEEIHTHWGDDKSSLEASETDKKSKDFFDNWYKNENGGTGKVVHSIYNATTKTWITY